MKPIRINLETDLDSSELDRYLGNVFSRQKRNNRALAFAFLVYDFEDHTITKILADREYWNSLHHLSGDRLTIFYIDSQDEYFNYKSEAKLEREIKERDKLAKQGCISYWQPLVKEDTPLDKANTYLKEIFGVDQYLETPFLIFFQTDGAYVTGSFVVTLRKEKLEDAFLELKRDIAKAVDSVAEVTPENFENHDAIFGLIESEVKDGRYIKFVKSKVSIGTAISAISFIAKLILGSMGSDANK